MCRTIIVSPKETKFSHLSLRERSSAARVRGNALEGQKHYLKINNPRFSECPHSPPMIDEKHTDWPDGPSLTGWLNPGPLKTCYDALMALIVVHIADAKICLKLNRILAKVSRERRAQANHNLNLQIKAFVLACPKRVAYVRSIIGEGAITRWLRRDKNLCRAAKPRARPGRENRKMSEPAPYVWKRYGLPKIANSLTPQRLRSNLSAPSKPGRKWPRAKRILKPVIFWPHELRPKAKTGPSKAPAPKAKTSSEVFEKIAQSMRAGNLEPKPP